MDSNATEPEDLKETIQKYLKKWIDEEEEPKSSRSLQFQRALRSITSVRCEITVLENCETLFGFDSFLINCLKKAMEESAASSSLGTDPFEYRPKVGSGAYAILLTLHDQRSLTKEEIETEAQQLCKYSFKTAKRGTSFTAWSAMKILIDRKLVRRSVFPIRYNLTPLGRTMAQALINTEKQKAQLAAALISNEQSEECENQEDQEQEQDQDPHEESINGSLGVTAGDVSSEQNRVQHDINLEVDFSKCGVMQMDVDPHESAVSNLINDHISDQFRKINEEFLKSDFKLSNNNFYVILIIDIHHSSNLESLIDEFYKYKIEFEVRVLSVGTFAWIVREKYGNRELLLPYVVERIGRGRLITQTRITNEIRFKYSGFMNVFILMEFFDADNVRVTSAQFHEFLTHNFMFTNFKYAVSKSFSETVQIVAHITNYIEKKIRDKQLFLAGFNTAQCYLDNNDVIPLLSYSHFQRVCLQTPVKTVQGAFAYALIDFLGISFEKALAISKLYPTIRHLIEKYKTMDTKGAESLLTTIRYDGMKKIGITLSRRVHNLLMDPYIV